MQGAGKHVDCLRDCDNPASWCRFYIMYPILHTSFTSDGVHQILCKPEPHDGRDKHGIFDLIPTDLDLESSMESHTGLFMSRDAYLTDLFVRRASAEYDIGQVHSLADVLVPSCVWCDHCVSRWLKFPTAY